MRVLLFLIIIICSSSCQRKSRKTIVEKDIPIWYENKPDLFYQLISQKSKQLKLDKLEKGFDSLQIRIWYDSALSNRDKLVIFKLKDFKWKGFYYSLNVEWNAYKLTNKVKKSHKIEIHPKSGWKIFISKILENKIESLPNMKDINGLVDRWSDGKTYSIEIATKSKYRFYNYHLPEKFLEFEEAKNMVEILKVIESEFGIKK